MAGRAVAAANGFLTIDFELMALTLHTDTYLKDRMHPKGVRSALTMALKSLSKVTSSLSVILILSTGQVVVWLRRSS